MFILSVHGKELQIGGATYHGNNTALLNRMDGVSIEYKQEFVDQYKYETYHNLLSGRKDRLVTSLLQKISSQIH